MQTLREEHVRWLIDTGEKLTLDNGKSVDVWVLRHVEDDDMLSAWAMHLRNHYCLDDEIDFYRRGLGLSRTDYLNNIKLPDSIKAPGPSIRAGDFSEILVSDYLQFILDYWVPRTRYGDKTVRNESTKGSDVIGFKIIDEGHRSFGFYPREKCLFGNGYGRI